MNLDTYSKEKLWLILVETVHANVMYPSHKSYTRDVILQAHPQISTEQLASRLNMPLGEALVIIDELVTQKEN